MYKAIFNRLWEVSFLAAIVCTIFAISTTLTNAESEETFEAEVTTPEEVVEETIEDVVNYGADDGAISIPEAYELIPAPDFFPPEFNTTPLALPFTETMDIEEGGEPTNTIEEVTQSEDVPVVTEAPVLTTDKGDYAPGETVTIFGRFFTPVKSFFVRVFGNSEVGNFWSDTTHEVVSDENGAWSISQALDNFYRPLYDMVVTDEDNNIVAEGQFTDAAGAAVVVFDQCANDDGDGYNANPGDCLWTNGNMNTNNSTIYEEDSTVQRLVMDGLTNGQHVVTLEYQTTKGGKHAYDFLTDFDQSEIWVNQAKLCAGDATTKFPSCATATPFYSPDIPHDPLNVSGNVDTNQNIMILNGTITNVSAPVKVSGSYAADSLTQINVTFTVNTNTCLNKDTQGNTNSCPVFMAWGAHVSSQADWGIGQSALDISGSPYHMKVVALDGSSTGKRDNQMQADAITPIAAEAGTIIIEKQTLPNGDSQSFTFDPSWSGQSFTLSDNQSTSTTQLPGTYSVVETVPSGWLQTSAVCTSSLGDAETIGTIELDNAEIVTCVFINTKLGALTLIKNTVGGNGDFDFDATGTGLSTDIDLTTVAGTAQSTFTNLNPANIYTLAETVPSGWLLNSAVCDNSETIENINIDPGQTVTCTFTNTKQPTLTVNKVLVPSNDLGKFNLRIDDQTAGTGANVGNGGTTGAQTVSVGAHTVSETAGTDTTLADYTGVIGGDCALNGSITLAAGENKVCTITNTRNMGTIELQKDFVGTPESVTIKIGTSQNSTQVDSDVFVADGTNGEHTVNTGTYFVSETLTTPARYTSALACYNDVNDNNTVDGGDTAHTVNTTTGEVAVGSNDDVLCVYTNTRNTGTVVIKKVMIGGTDTFDFTGTPNGSISTDGSTIQSVVETGAYVGTEGAKTGWDLTSVVCDSQNSTGDVNARTANFNVESGETVTCTFTNTKRGTITIEKQTLPDADPASFTFTGDVIGSLSDGQTVTQAVVPGAYSSTEALKAGWDLTGISCDDGDSSGVVGTGVATFNVAAGENVKCTFTNTKKGHLIVQKTTLPAVDQTQFTIAASGSGTITGGGAGIITDAADKDYEVTPGTYSVAETVPAGWDKTGDTCQNVAVAAGETKTCLITNTKRGTVTIIKNAIENNTQDFTFNNNFGNGHPATFLLDDDSNATLLNTRSFEVIPGTFAVSEDVVAGWQLESATCSDGSPVSAIVVSPGETIICTFTNEELANIILVKNTFGGDSEFSFGKTGAGFAGTTTLTTVGGTASQTFSGLDQDNSYSVAESVPVGWDLTSAVCTGTNRPASITPNAGETVTCTFTNTKRGNIIVDKVTNPAGDTQSFDFTTNAGSNFALTDTAAPHDSGAVVPGVYSVVETLPAGWDQTSATCDDGSLPGAISLQAGETVTCTFTNEKDAYIIVDKVTNPVGDDTEFEFDTNYGANFPLADETTPNSSGDLAPGAYDVAELAEEGWDLTNTSCVSSKGDSETASALSLQAGETITCTFTNVKDSYIIVRKETLPDGDAQSFTFAASYDLDGFALIDGQSNNSGDIDAGTYSVSETVPAGWANTSATCSDGSPVGAILVAAGETVTCTFVNNKPAAQIDLTPLTAVNEVGDTHTITAEVQVQNGDGVWGPAANNTVVAFSLSNANGSTADFVGSNTCMTTAGTCTVTINSLTAGNVTIHASSTPTVLGIALTVESGIGGLNSGDVLKTYVDAKISINPPTATNNVGEAHVFTVTVMENDGEGFDLSEGEEVTFTFGTNTAGATFVGGINTCTTVANGTCSVSINTNTPGNVMMHASTSAHVGGLVLTRETDGTHGSSQDASKKYVAGKIIVKKVTLGGDADFTFNPSYSETDFVLGNGDEDTSGWLSLAGEYSVSETIPSGWEQVSATCDKDETPGAISIDSDGEVVTCTFTNGKLPTLTLEKTVITDNGGTAVKNDFQGKIDGINQAWDAAKTVATGAHTASETTLPGYMASAWGGDCAANGTISLAYGENKTCTITNDDNAPTLHLRKVVVNNNGGTSTVANFTLTANGTGANDIGGTSPVDSGAGLDADTFALSETNVAGYDASAWVCVGGTQNGANITLGLGQEATCTITNDDKPAKLTIVKDAQPNDAANFAFSGTLGAFTLDDDAGVVDSVDPLGQYENSKIFTNVNAGAVTVTETQPNQYWKLKSATCMMTGTSTIVPSSLASSTLTIALALDQDVTCTFVNEKLAPTRTQGFWSTHTVFTSAVFGLKFPNGMLIGSTTNGHKGVILNNSGLAQSHLYGAWYASIPKTTSGTQRSALDKARMQLLQQLVTAKLNCAQFGCPASVQTMIVQADAAYAGNSAAAILTSAGLMDQYNNSGDSIIVGNTGKATPKDSKNYANLLFWNAP